MKKLLTLGALITSILSCAAHADMLKYTCKTDANKTEVLTIVDSGDGHGESNEVAIFRNKSYIRSDMLGDGATVYSIDKNNRIILESFNPEQNRVTFYSSQIMTFETYMCELKQ